jgi:hydroxymethylbilane synthase
MDELSGRAARNRDARLGELGDAREIVDAALVRLVRRLSERRLGPLQAALHERFRATAAEQAEQLLRGEFAGLDAARAATLRDFGETLARHLAHLPSAGLRQLAERHGMEAVESFVAAADPDLRAALERALARRLAAQRRTRRGRPVRTVIGTRGSALALAQARWTAERLAAAGLPCELEVIRTAGDVDQHSPFAQVGAPGVFVREIEQALLDGRIDIAVHSYKDLPSRSPAGLEVVAVSEREDPRDVLVTRGDPPGPGAVVGTSAARRRVLVGELHPGWRPRELRGNVPTRVEKLRRGEYDAIVLAAAGLARLARAGGIDLAGLQIEPLDPRRFVPAPAQGALALQQRAGDPRIPAVRGST